MSYYNPPLNLGASSPLTNGTLVVFLLGIVEVFSTIFEGPSLDFLTNEIEWTVPKRKIRARNRADIGLTMRIGRPLIRKFYQKEIKKDIVHGKKKLEGNLEP